MSGFIDLIFSVSFFQSLIRVTTPILFATLGALISERAGVTNLAIEGIMLFAALFGVIGSAYSQSVVVGVLVAVISAVLVTMILSYFTLVLDADSTLSCIALNLLASGATVFILFIATGNKLMSNALSSLTLSKWKIPFIEKIPVLGEILSNQFSLTYVAFLMVILIHILLFKTPLGLRIRAVGENPNAASSVGISVSKTRFIALLISGILSGLGGVYMSMGYMSMFTRDMIAGRGYIALAAANVGGQSPIGGMFAAILFGVFDALSNNMQQFQVPSQLVQTIPYLATIVFLGMSSYKKMKKRKTAN